MKRAIMVVSILFVILITPVFHGFMLAGETWNVSFVIQEMVIYSNKGTNIWNFTKEDRTISLFMNNTWQEVNLANHSWPLESTTVDEDGNPIAVLNFTKSELKPGENLSYTVSYGVLSKPRSLPEINEEESQTLEEIPEDLIQKYCVEGDAWLVNDSELQQLAHDAAENKTKVLTIVKKFVAWIWENINYHTYDVPLYPNETLTYGEGDCDDQAILLVTLCRIYKIPSYLQVGCIYTPTPLPEKETYWEGHVTLVLKRIGWHGWAIVYVPPWGWIPVDLTYMTAGRDDPLNAIKAGAITLQTTIQCMNVDQMDYVASTRRTRDFLINNDFYVYTRHEMIQEVNLRSILEEILERWLQLILIAMVIVAVVLVGVFTYIQKAEKERLKRANQHGEELRKLR